VTVTEDRTKDRPVALREPAAEAAVERRDRWARRSLILPAMIYTIVVTQIPFVLTIWYSLQSWNLLRPGTRKFVGLANYGAVFSQSGFRTAVWNTITFTASAVIFSLIIGLVLAVLLDQKFRGRAVVRTLLISPFLVMPVAGICITHQRESFVPVDEHNQALRNAILWDDARSLAQLDELGERFGHDQLHRRTGRGPSVAQASSKLLWRSNTNRRWWRAPTGSWTCTASWSSG
jgi:sorbitol/mannitol transport system permease protein